MRSKALKHQTITIKDSQSNQIVIKESQSKVVNIVNNTSYRHSSRIWSAQQQLKLANCNVIQPEKLHTPTGIKQLECNYPDSNNDHLKIYNTLNNT